MDVLEKIAEDYFKENGRDDLRKAFFAYRAPHPNGYPQADLFTSSLKSSQCQRCGRTREQVRWDVLPPECAKYETHDIQEIILQEEQKFQELLDKAIPIVNKTIKQFGLTGKTLSILHHTYGYNLDIVSEIIDISPDIIAQYHEEMNLEKQKSKQAYKPKEIK